MRLTLFSNSTLYIPMVDKDTVGGDSCLDYLRREYTYNLNGYWSLGLTVLHVNWNMGLFLNERNRGNVVLVNLGCVEAYTHPAENFLYWSSRFIEENGLLPSFQHCVLPRMIEASDSLVHKRISYFRVLEPDPFKHLLKSVLSNLEGFRVVLVGMNRPNRGNENVSERWFLQGWEYENILREVAESFSYVTFLECWNTMQDYVVDTNHLTPDGHLFLFNRVKEVLQ